METVILDYLFYNVMSQEVEYSERRQIFYLTIMYQFDYVILLNQRYSYQSIIIRVLKETDTLDYS